MHARRIGGALVIGGLVACLAALAVIVVGDPVGGGLHSVATLIFPAALAPVAIGAIILGVAGPPPVHARSIRAGLTMLGVGLLGYQSASYVPAPDGMNSLQSWPHIIALLGGVALVAAGLLVTGLAFARSRRR